MFHPDRRCDASGSVADRLRRVRVYLVQARRAVRCRSVVEPEGKWQLFLDVRVVHRIHRVIFCWLGHLNCLRLVLHAPVHMVRKHLFRLTHRQASSADVLCAFVFGYLRTHKSREVPDEFVVFFDEQQINEHRRVLRKQLVDV